MSGVTFLILLLVGLATVVMAQNGSSSVPDYQAWKAKYRPNETLQKSQQQNGTAAEKTFQANAAKVAKHNSNKNATYKQELNANADMTASEIKSKRKGYVHKVANVTTKKTLSASANTIVNQLTQPLTPVQPQSLSLKAAPPQSLNLTSGMTPVKNQGNCGSCWAFATMAVVEYWVKKSGSSMIFSEQDLMNCCTANGGCAGGNLLDSFACMIQIGVALASNYPYKGVNGVCPRTNKISYKLPNASGGDTKGVENFLMQLLNKFGPIAVAIATLNTGFDLYSSGVFYDPKCSNDLNLADHAVVVVGYGTDPKGGDYWIVRNSWGPTFGMNGYILMARNRNNNCGIANTVGYYMTL